MQDPQRRPQETRRPLVSTASTSASSLGAASPGGSALSCPMSSNDSGETEQSDAFGWFERSNENPVEAFGPRGTDTDTPFLQSKSTDESLKSKTSTNGYFPPGSIPPLHYSGAVTTSSTDEYRGVIDDLTIEIQQLKEELRKYKQHGAGRLKKDALFEVRVHGLDKKEKRELENILRNFASIASGSTLKGSSKGSSGRQDKDTSPSWTASAMNSSGVGSKHALSRGSWKRTTDSGYVSGPRVDNTTIPTQNQSISSQVHMVEQKVQSYLDGVPEGLVPSPIIITDKDKKKLVVKRLEKIFTGKMGARKPVDGKGEPQQSLITPGEPSQARTIIPLPLPSNAHNMLQATRQAMMLTAEDGTGSSQGHHYSNKTTSSVLSDQAGSGGMVDHSRINGSYGSNESTGSGRHGKHSSPDKNTVKHKQRPTRAHDLNPARAQLPSDDMDYFRHLGMVPPSNLSETVFSAQDVAHDADGWVWLNLICNMAHIHMLNVTPSFVRNAVAEKSTKFQISADGQKIRWRGGTEGTRFSSDSSGENSRREQSTDESSPESIIPCKRVKTQHLTESTSDSTWGADSLRFTPQAYNPTRNSFHYKPIFAHQASSTEQTSDPGLSLKSASGNSNSDGDGCRPKLSSGSSRSRTEGPIMYYHGAPFCTDLSRDPLVGLTPSPCQEHSPPSSNFCRRHPATKGAMSGAFAPTRSLSEYRPISENTTSIAIERKSPGYVSSSLKMPLRDSMQIEEGDPEGERETYEDEDEDDEEEDIETTLLRDPDCKDLEMFPSYEVPGTKDQRARMESFEAAGLGGVIPEDHFHIHVTTVRSKTNKTQGGGRRRSTIAYTPGHESENVVEMIGPRINNLITTSAVPPPPQRTISQSDGLDVEIQYLSGHTRKLDPSPLAPAATFFPPFSSDEEDDVVDVDSSGASS